MSEERKVYVVEAWSNEMGTDSFHDGRCHYTETVHIASSLEEAKVFCKAHPDWAGKPGQGEYFPWHWKIFETRVDQDVCCSIGDSYECVLQIDPEHDSEIIDAEFEEIEDYTDPASKAFADSMDNDWGCGCDDCDPEECENVDCTCSSFGCPGMCDYEKNQTKETKGRDVFEKWLAWWQTRCEWYAEPSYYETWDGCIDSMKAIIRNFAFDDFDDFEKSIDDLCNKLDKMKTL